MSTPHGSECQKICMVIGDPIAHSLSPLMHNAGYRACGLEKKFIFVPARVAEEDLGAAVEGMRAFGVRGMSVTIPHKQSVMASLDVLDPLAEQAGAVNTIVNEQGRLHGFNTDCDGIIAPLETRCALAGLHCVVLGAGGAARAAIAALLSQGAEVSVLNRSEGRLAELQAAFSIHVGPLSAHSVLSSAQVLINTTPLGMAGDQRMPVDPGVLEQGMIVFDTVYTPYWTPLLRAAQERGATCIHGLDMFVAQGARQFELYTGHPAPTEMLRHVVAERLGGGE